MAHYPSMATDHVGRQFDIMFGSDSNVIHAWTPIVRSNAETDPEFRVGCNAESRFRGNGGNAIDIAARPESETQTRTPVCPFGMFGNWTTGAVLSTRCDRKPDKPGERADVHDLCRVSLRLRQGARVRAAACRCRIWLCERSLRVSLRRLPDARALLRSRRLRRMSSCPNLNPYRHRHRLRHRNRRRRRRKLPRAWRCRNRSRSRRQSS